LIFIQRPLAAVLLVAVLVSLLWPLAQSLRQRRSRLPLATL
jgi:TctA family transporter